MRRYIKNLILIIIIFISASVYGKLNNIFIAYSYYNNEQSTMFLGYDLDLLKIKIGSQFDFQFSSELSIPFYYSSKFVLEPYFNYSSFKSLGIKLGYENLSFRYNYSKKYGNLFGFDFEIPIIKFGKDSVSTIKSKDNIKIVAGNELSIKLMAKTKNSRPAENINLFYNINDLDLLYIGKTNSYGELELNIDYITKSGSYIINIYDNNKTLLKKIRLEVVPSLPDSIKFDFDKEMIYTEEDNFIKIKNLKVFDRYNNEIINPDIKFLEFKFIGNDMDINYTYLNDSLIVESIEKSGIYEIYYKSEIDNKIISGTKKIIVENNPKNIKEVKTNIKYIGSDSGYAIFKIEIPKITFLNSEVIESKKFFVYSNNQKIELENNIFKIPLNEIPDKFIVDVYYYNYLKTVTIENKTF